MLRQLDFKNPVLYTMTLTALRFGRSLDHSAPGKQVLRTERNIWRKMKEIGEPDPQKSNDLHCPKCGELVMQGDKKNYRLKEGGGAVTLEQEEVELLMDRIDKGPWTGDAAEDMADTLDFLSAAPSL